MFAALDGAQGSGREGFWRAPAVRTLYPCARVAAGAALPVAIVAIPIGVMALGWSSIR
jgi:hypothetical protein